MDTTRRPINGETSHVKRGLEQRSRILAFAFVMVFTTSFGLVIRYANVQFTSEDDILPFVVLGLCVIFGVIFLWDLMGFASQLAQLRLQVELSRQVVPVAEISQSELFSHTPVQVPETQQVGPVTPEELNEARADLAVMSAYDLPQRGGRLPRVGSRRDLTYSPGSPEFLRLQENFSRLLIIAKGKNEGKALDRTSMSSVQQFLMHGEDASHSPAEIKNREFALIGLIEDYLNRSVSEIQVSTAVSGNSLDESGELLRRVTVLEQRLDQRMDDRMLQEHEEQEEAPRERRAGA